MAKNMCTQNKTGKSKVSVYASGEELMMDFSQSRRHQIFLPLLKWFVRQGITPNHLTGLSLLCGTGFCFLIGLDQNWTVPAALVLLLLHILLDGIDGPLARFQGTSGNRGSFTDTTADQLVVTFTTIALIHSGLATVIAGSLYLFFYTLVVVFAMVRSSLAIPYSWLVRPRLIVYAWIPIEIYFLPGTLSFLLWICVGVLVWKSITGFIQIRNKL
ncbi:CDP-alcohol phosphatidyltransferase family protein [Gimesia sp.]|uniref:CDP-alcohol phosphatidyltransferase family protein n=1 Tax=Gimesia sp. TaxID=2024833 RepID=UPI003A8DD452